MKNKDIIDKDGMLMCGILGGNIDTWNYDEALNELAHRGPDGKCIKRYNNFTMGFARLAIIDLSNNGMQPMTSRNGNITITYNGEIYGYIKLKEELIKKGYQFYSTTDTEVILNSYIEWGDEFIHHFDGMFAISIYDKKKQCVKLFRDRCGIKPLYYYYENGRFAYSSELKGLTKLINDTKLIIDNTAVYDFYNYLYIPDPKSYYKNIYKLEQAHQLKFDLNTNKIQTNSSYWTLKVNAEEGNSKPSTYVIQDLKQKIQKSVEEQLVADVSTGAFLSGGIDSSIITLEALKKEKAFKTYSIGFYDFEANELPYVNCLEKKLNFKAKKYMVKREEYVELFNNIKDWFDEPFSDTSAYPTYIVSKLAKNGCTVALSGDGGDEIFGGYSRYHELKRYEQEKQASYDEMMEQIWEIHLYNPRPNRDKIRKILGINRDYDEKWFYKKFYIKDLPPITRQQYMDFHTYLPCDVLTKTDRVAMANSLEVRVPLLSTNIIEYVFSLTEYERCYQGKLKYLLKEAYKNEIPSNLLHRKKWGFSIPSSFFNYTVIPQEKIVNELFMDKL